jgi:hypothetical protein
MNSVNGLDVLWMLFGQVANSWSFVKEQKTVPGISPGCGQEAIFYP